MLEAKTGFFARAVSVLSPQGVFIEGLALKIEAKRFLALAPVPHSEEKADE